MLNYTVSEFKSLHKRKKNVLSRFFGKIPVVKICCPKNEYFVIFIENNANNFVDSMQHGRGCCYLSNSENRMPGKIPVRKFGAIR